VKPPWLIRNLTVLQLKPSIASEDDLIIQVGFVGAALGSSIGALNVARSAADGFFVAPWCHLKWASNLCTVYQLSAWRLLPVSPLSHLLGFRSDIQVSLLPLFHSPYRVICCHGFHLLDGRLKPTMVPFGLQFTPTMCVLYFCWMLIKLGFLQDKICRNLGHFCDDQLVAIREDFLLIFVHFMPLGRCVEGIFANFVQVDVLQLTMAAFLSMFWAESRLGF